MPTLQAKCVFCALQSLTSLTHARPITAETMAILLFVPSGSTNPKPIFLLPRVRSDGLVLCTCGQKPTGGPEFRESETGATRSTTRDARHQRQEVVPDPVCTVEIMKAPEATCSKGVGRRQRDFTMLLMPMCCKRMAGRQGDTAFRARQSTIVPDDGAGRTIAEIMPEVMEGLQQRTMTTEPAAGLQQASLLSQDMLEGGLPSVPGQVARTASCRSWVDCLGHGRQKARGHVGRCPGVFADHQGNDTLARCGHASVEQTGFQKVLLRLALLWN